MKKQLLYLFFIATIVVLCWFLYEQIQSPIIFKIFLSFLTIAVFSFIKFALDKSVIERIKNSKSRYSFRKITGFISGCAVIVAFLSIWIQNPQSLTVAFGVFAAGISIALQDLLKNVAGGLIIFVSHIYRVGDRVEIDSKFGDVIDIGVTNTTLMEVKEWVNGDQPTGRLISVPNGVVLSGSVPNYTKDYGFIWDEIVIPISYDSDWKEATQEFTKIAKQETAEIIQQAEKELVKAGGKYYYDDKNIEPEVLITLTDNWINCHIRYITDVRNRRSLNDQLNRKLLDYIHSSERVKIANSSSEINITHVPDINLNKQV